MQARTVGSTSLYACYLAPRGGGGGGSSCYIQLLSMAYRVDAALLQMVSKEFSYPCQHQEKIVVEEQDCTSFG